MALLNIKKILFPAEVELHVASIQKWEIIFATVLSVQFGAILGLIGPFFHLIAQTMRKTLYA